MMHCSPAHYLALADAQYPGDGVVGVEHGALQVRGQDHDDVRGPLNDCTIDFHRRCVL
jgi:hypothetical protein